MTFNEGNGPICSVYLHLAGVGNPNHQVCFKELQICCFVAYLQQFLSCGPLLWVLCQSKFDKMVEVVCPAAQQRGEDIESKGHI